MKKIFIIVAVLFFTTNAYSETQCVKNYILNQQDNWTTVNTIQELSFEWLAYVDMKQTQHGARLGWEEVNPFSKIFLGSHPSQNRIKFMVTSAMILHPIISYLLPPKARQFWFGVTIYMQINDTNSNRENGLSAGIMRRF